MNPNSQVGRILIVGGVVMIVAGLLFLAGARFPWLLQWLRPGHLPGDFVWTNASGSFRIYFPIATSLLLSLLLTLIFRLFR